jgi:hypothetical protein
MLGPGRGLPSWGTEALPKHPNDQIGVLDAHQLIDHALRPVEMHRWIRVGLPAPQRQHQPTVSSDGAIELLNDRLSRRALHGDIARGNEHDSNTLHLRAHDHMNLLGPDPPLQARGPLPGDVLTVA